MFDNFWGWDRAYRVVQILRVGLIVLALVSISISAFTSAHWGRPVAGGCAVLLGMLTATLYRQAPLRRKQS